MHSKPDLTTIALEQLVNDHYGLRAIAKPLPGEADQNALIVVKDERRYVLKIANAATPKTVLELQNRAMAHLAQRLEVDLPKLVPSVNQEEIVQVHSPDDGLLLMRLLTFVEGDLWAKLPEHPPALREQLGQFLGRLTLAMETFSHPAAHRYLLWDLKHTNVVVRQYLRFLHKDHRPIVERCLEVFEREALPALFALPCSVIHNDANDYNVLTRDLNGLRCVSGLIDFGDVIHSYTIGELAIGCAYALLNQSDPLQAIADVTAGYHQQCHLEPGEIEVLLPLIIMRLCVSVCVAAKGLQEHPENAYLQVSNQPAWDALNMLSKIDLFYASETIKRNCGLSTPQATRTTSELTKARRGLLNPGLSLAYNKPLNIVRGRGVYLYDEKGNAYLDMVNNVCHVGHCHPDVVRAGQRQLAQLNTNTRYLHKNIMEFAERLTATLPDPLKVCTFVCSGSEANDLAWRMAQAYTGGTDAIVIEGAYHGNLSSMVTLSPYKFAGPGGKGKADYVYITPMPDPYRGEFRSETLEAGKRYAQTIQSITNQLNCDDRKLAAFFCESIQGVGGQIVMPDDYLVNAYQHVRKAGGVCVADEVQVGLGRVGSHYWAFETQGVLPDIITIGKPLGNGHPVAAVVTTPQIAQAFDNGMEYFNTFGGNPVSCAIGLEVLSVIEREGLQQNAHELGHYLQTHLRPLKYRFELIGDVRGLGLFVGIELVLNRQTLEPAPRQAAMISEKLKDEGILVTTEGPLGNVLKIKPPLVFSKTHADRFLEALEKILGQTEFQP